MATHSSNITSGFIDIATYDELEKYAYGGSQATAYFVREVMKSNWFTIIPVPLARSSGSPDFGQEWAVNVPRSGDYLLHTWLRLKLPAVSLLSSNSAGLNGRLRWTKNLMHNLIKEAQITFNDLVAQRFDNYHLDFWSQFAYHEGKQNGYANMIGNVEGVVDPHGPGDALHEMYLNLPLPFFFTRDSGVALPCAALPFNEIQIRFTFQNWENLLIFEDISLVGNKKKTLVVGPASDIAMEPKLTNVIVFAEYALVSNEERKRMASGKRDILIEQVQTAPRLTYNPIQNAEPSFDIRFSHAVKVLFFAVRNATHKNEWSNYTTSSPVVTGTGFAPIKSFDPIIQTSLVYENQNRLANMGSDYFSLVAPFYRAPRIPSQTGYHIYPYALDFCNLDPTGSTNYGKLSNVSIIPKASDLCITGADGTGPVDSGLDYPQKYEFVITAVNHNIVRILGGALGFPVL